VSGERPHPVYVGDDTGNILLFSQRRTGAVSHATTRLPSALASNFTLVERSVWPKVHTLGVDKVLLVPGHNLLVSISFDCTCVVSDATKGVPVMSVAHPHAVRYTSVAWHAERDELILADSHGRIEAWDTYRDKQIACFSLPALGPPNASGTPVLTSLSWARDDELIANMPQACAAVRWRVLRDKKLIEFNGHTDKIISVEVIDDPSKKVARSISHSLSRVALLRRPSKLHVSQVAAGTREHPI
jgi:WD40 repeat protein